MRAIVGAVLLLTIFCGSNLEAVETLKVGDAAPEFEMTGSDGKPYQLSDFLGKKAVVIAWFPRAFTGGCTKECKSMREAGEQLRDYNVAYFTASTDTVEKNSDFAKSLDLDYPILCDPAGRNAKLFGVLRPDGKTANRVTFIITKDGKIASIDRQVKTQTHGEDLVKKLQELQIEKAK